MKQNKRRIVVAVVAACLCMFTHTASANKIAVTNIMFSGGGDGYAFVQADISWNNSWKASWVEGAATITNWDAAWVFVKYRVATNNAPWLHATLSTNNSEHIVPTQAMINVGLSTNAGATNFGCGVFLYRKNEGGGNWNNTVKLRWNYAQDGLVNTDRVDVCVNAIEMVYVPQGSFYVGDGTANNVQGQFCSSNNYTKPLQITSEGALTLGGGGAGSLGNNNTNGMATADDFTDGVSQTLPSAYPKGYNGFYCMKYEISQGQYTDFLNILTSGQATKRYPNKNGNYRHTISGSYPNFTNTAPDRACNYLSWPDVAAYADWAGLRPMTELEFEKACRGPLTPVVDEYAWGNTTLTSITNFVGTDGSGTETAMPLTANCCSHTKVQGPVRCGLFATASSTRTASGASYWGIMEMSGNLFERSVTVGNVNGRAFTGAVGDGKLNATGDADAANWPDTSANGAGFRGGRWSSIWTGLRVSGRNSAAGVDPNRAETYGGRVVRSAPSGE
jgi:formylglycine-generating enzyme required for sulfatase activity